jgi:hypothetical protein
VTKWSHVNPQPLEERIKPRRASLHEMAHLRKTLGAALLFAACLLPAAAAPAAAPAATAATAATATPATAAPGPLGCNSADLRYPFMPGGPRKFGVFELQVAHGGCATAHRVAQAWMTRFETALRAGNVRTPRSVDGFTFTTLPVHVAQTFRERGQLGATTIWFEYRIPNG